MKKYLRYVDKLHDRVLTQKLDRIIPVLADEGYGKSTLMLSTIYYYESEVKGREMTPEDCLDHVVWSDADDYRDKLVSLPEGSCIAVMDAARMLFRKDAMKDEQKEIEKDLYDSRAFNHLVLLGFQNPRSVPEDLGGRRAKNLIHIPSRGRIHGYSRSAMNEFDWQDTSNLPDPDLRDSFKSLDGTPLWDAFEEEDIERKKDRIAPDEEDGEQTPIAVLTAESVLNEDDRDFEWFVSIDGRSGELYLDADMLGLEYDLTQREAEQTKKLLHRQEEVVVEADRVLLDGDVVKEVDLSDDETDDDSDETLTLKDIAEDVYENLGEFIGEDGRTGDFLLDPDRIAFHFDISDRKARQVRKAVEDYDDVSVNDDVVSVAGNVVASQSREV